MIFHLTTPAQWAFYESRDCFLPAYFASEGFIHCSTEAQIEGVLSRYFVGVAEILLLKIDESKLAAPLKWEVATSTGESFPHVFGPLNKSAIVAVERVR